MNNQQQSPDTVDTLLEGVFADLARLAVEICAVPTAILSLSVEGHNWQTMHSTINDLTAAQDLSLHRHALAGSQLLVVPDTLADQRFSADPLVASGNVRFYAGLPLRMANGQVTGILCVLDRQPRTLSDQQQEALAALGRIATTQFALRQKAGASPAQEQMTVLELRNRALAATSVGVVITDMTQPDHPIIYCNPAFETITGYTPAETIGYNCRFLQGPDTSQEALKELRQAIRTGQTCQVVLKNYRKDGTPFWNELTISPVYTSDGRLTNFIGVQSDITEKQQLQEEIIRIQTAALDELSTPLIPISDHVVVMPLIGTVDGRRAQLVLETLLAGVLEHRADTAILDITGVPVVDTQVANALIRAAQAVRLLGARVILTGIRPEIAQTLVGLGVELTGIITRSTLQNGISLAVQGIGKNQ